MSKIYQPQLNNENWIPHQLYMQIIYLIRDYDRMKAEYTDMLEESPAPSDGMPKGTAISDPTVSKAFKTGAIHDRIKAIDKAIESIPYEYRQPILDNIRHGSPMPGYANRKTWGKWKARLIKRVGENLYLI